MFEFIDLYDEYLSEQRRIADTDSTTAEITSTESIPNIDENFMKMLKASYEVLSYPIDTKGRYYKQDDRKCTKLEKKMIKMLEKIMKNKEETDIEFNNNIVLALAAYNFGKARIKTIKVQLDTKTSEEKDIGSLYEIANTCFVSCEQLLIDKKLNKIAILLYMKALDKSSYIYIKQQSLENCYKFSIHALLTYVNYTQNNKYPNPVDVATMLGVDNREDKELDTKMSLDKLHVENLKRLYLAYNEDPKDKHEYVAYMHDLLNTLIKEVFLHKNYMEWAMAATELSRYFIQHKRFTEARQYLAAASYMMEKGKTEHFATTKEKTTSDNQSSTEKLRSDLLDNQHRYQRAKIAKLWGQYGLQLLNASKQNLLGNITNQSCDADNLLENFDSTKSNEESNKESQKMLIFTNLEDELENFIEISDKYLLNFRDIKIVFEKILKSFNTAQTYFTVEKDIKTYGEIILQMSLAYKYFANFERHKDKQLNIHEQQIALLGDAQKKISNNTTINNIKKLISFELGICYATVLNIKADNEKISMFNEIPDQEMMEIKNYMRNSMNSFLSYLTYF